MRSEFGNIQLIVIAFEVEFINEILGTPSLEAPKCDNKEARLIG